MKIFLKFLFCCLDALRQPLLIQLKNSSWDEPIYKVGNPYKINGSGIIQQLIINMMRLE